METIRSPATLCPNSSSLIPRRMPSQVPVTLFPVPFGVPGGRAVGIRAFITRDFMTGSPALPGRDLPFEAVDEIVRAITAIEGISRVAFDISPKPPATTEWEEPGGGGK